MATIAELKAERERRKQTADVTKERLLAERSRRSLEKVTSFAEQIGRDVKGIGEAGLTIGTAAVAEPIAGAVALKDLVLEDAQAGAKTVQDIQQGLTFKPGESGREKLLRLGEGISQVSEIKGIDAIVSGAKTAIDVGREKAGDLGALLSSPLEFMTTGGKPTSEKAVKARGAAESLAVSFPFAALELSGVKGLRTLNKFDNVAVDAAKRAPTVTNRVKAVREVSGNAKKILSQAAPSVEELKAGAGAVYDQIDNMDVVINPEAVQQFTDRIAIRLRDEAFSPNTEPLVNNAFRELQNINRPLAPGEARLPVDTKEIRRLRKFAQKAVRSGDDNESRIGRILLNEFDDFITDLNPSQATGADIKGMGQLYKQAGDLWRRSIKTETIDDLFASAADATTKEGTTLSTALQNKFRSLVEKNRKTKQFDENEINNMRRVFKQGTLGGLLNFIGELDLTQGQRANQFVALSGVGAGFAAGGIGGAVAVPLLGNFSKRLADSLTAKRGEFAQAVVAAGADGDEIVNAYLRNVPKKQRDSIELTQLLVNSGADLEAVRSRAPIVREAVENAQTFTPEELALVLGFATPSETPQEVQ